MHFLKNILVRTFNRNIFRRAEMTTVVLLLGVTPLLSYITLSDISAVFATLLVAILLASSSFLFFIETRPITSTFKIILFSGVAFLGVLMVILMRDGFPIVSVSGLRFLSGTFVSFVAFFTSIVAGYLVVTSRGHANSLVRSAVIGVVLFTIVNTVVSIFDVQFITATSTLSFSTYMILGIGFILSGVLSFSSSSRMQLLPISGAVLSSAYILFSGSALLMFLAGISLLTVAILEALSISWRKILSHSSTVVIVVLTVALIGGGALLGIANVTPLESSIDRPLQEIRPSLGASIYILARTYESDPITMILGSGLNSFMYQWDTYFPKEVSATAFWDKDFQSGSSMFVTFALEIGIPLTLGIFLLGIFAIAGLFKFSAYEFERRIYVTGFAVIVIFGMLWALVYPPSTQFLLIIGLFGGALMGLREKEDARVDPSLISSKTAVVGLIGLSLILIVFSVTHILALYVHGKGISVLEENPPNYTQAIVLFEKATNYVTSPETLRLLTYTHLNLARQELNNEAPKEQIESNLSSAVDTAFEVQVIDARQYQTILVFGEAQLLSGIIRNDADFKDQALQSFLSAETKSPNRAIVQFNIAQAYISLGDEENARKSALKALKLRPQYKEVLKFLEVIGDAQ